MKKRRGTTTSAAAAAAIFVSTITSSVASQIILGVEAAAAAPSTSIRGGNNSGVAASHAISNNKRNDNSNSIKRRRPAILDSHQSDKITQWKEDHRSSSSSSSSSSRLLMINTGDENIDGAKKALFFHDDDSNTSSVIYLPQITPSGKRRLYDYMTLNHKKESDYGSVSVSKVDADVLHFQTVPPTTASTTSSTAVAAAATNSGGGSVMETYDHSSSSSSSSNINHYYYPISTPDHSVGTCTNNGNEPDHYSVSNGFLYSTLEECCEEWFVDAEECMVGFATSDNKGDELLLRDPYTGVPLLSSATTTPSDVLESASSSGGTTTTSSSVFYPSFEMTTWPDGACLNDGHQPEIYTTQEGYIFDSIAVCCHEWFIDEMACEQASLVASTSSSSSSSGGDHHEPIPSPTSDTDWPTWPIEFDYDDDDNVDDDTDTALDDFVAAPQEASSSTTTTAQEEESLSFYESFESGDFTRNDWRLTSSSADVWEADQSAWAYDGTYAARPGILSEPNTQSNLTISLDGIDAIRHGGYLTFAIHASVSYPVDVILFTINDNLIRTFDAVTGDEGEWEEVSILLHAGEHRLTWSYQYFGMLSESRVEVDPRRVGNSWVDAIKLRPFTGDVTIGDDDDTTLTLTNGMAPFKLLPDVDAYAGSKSFVAHTGAIDASQGSAEMSWEVYIGPDGGVISFVAFASLYAPQDVCEFSIDDVPQVVIATPSDEWEAHHVSVDAGKHELKWKLIKNVSGLNADTINDVDVPSDYQGYVKVDGIHLEDNSLPRDADEEVLVASAEEVPDTTTTTTTVTPTSTSEPITTSTTTTTTTEATTTSTTTTEKLTTTISSFSIEEEVAATTSTTQEPSTTTTTTTELVECPSNLFSVEGLPGCCVEEPSYLGDGACDPRAPYNSEACAFDLGDCCTETCNPDSAYGCITKEGGEYGPFGFFCIDPRFGNMDAKKCQVENLEWIGDGGCDADGGYNTPECGWDGGDCCEETCDPAYSFYPCGTNQPYTCLDPSVLNKERNSNSPFAFSDGDAAWKIDASKASNEGKYYVAARTGDISPQYGTAKLKHGIESFGGGVLSFDIQALVQIPFDDVIIMIDDDIVAEFTSSTAGWERHALDVSVGPHLVQWIHRKNPSNMLETDLSLFGYPEEGVTMLDNVAFQPS
jgi:hypothetical protein